MKEQDQVGQYTLVRKLGEGGMAEVWEARHVHLGSRAAIKFLLPEFSRNQELQERFLNEGKRQAQLQHPNIVPAMDFFQVEGRSFLVMQYVEGTNLETILGKNNPPLTLDQIHSISWDVLSALDYAHSRGVVHRDVKPSNLLLDKSGRVMIMDFGIALALTEEHRLTQTNTAMGTPDYMSPEQIVSPKSVDARSDIYSFGCVLYAMLSGDPPFSSEESTAFYIQDCHVRMALPPLVYRNSGIPPTVGDVVCKCLEKEPANRFQTCGEVMHALEAAISAPEEVATPKKKDNAARTKTQIESRPKTEIEAAPLPKAEPKPEPPLEAIVPSTSKSGGFGKYAIAGVVVLLLIGGVTYFLMGQGSHRKSDLEKRNWRSAQYNDPDFSDCMGIAACVERKAAADKLMAIQDWQQLPYNSPILQDCMAFPACEGRKRQADRLVATKDWAHADPRLHSDCMGYSPCLEKPKVKVTSTTVSRPQGTTTPGDLEVNLPACCSKASDPAACSAIKKREQIADCSSPLDN